MRGPADGQIASIPIAASSRHTKSKNLTASLSRFSVTNADINEVSVFYRRTIAPVAVQSTQVGAPVSVDRLHVKAGPYDLWSDVNRHDIEVSFVAPTESLCILTPLTGALAVTARGVRLTAVPGSLVAVDFQPADSIFLKGNCGHLGLAFARSVVVRELSELLDAPVLQDFEIVGEIDAGKARDVVKLATFIWARLADLSTGTPPDSLIRGLFRAALVTLLEICPHRYSDQLVRPVSPAAPRHVKRAIEFMMANISSQMGIGEIARNAGTSTRSLQVAFQKFKGCSPLEYLRKARLEEVRREISEASDGNTITAIARKWGFTHMGRFSSIYKEAFGELPTETLQEAKSARGRISSVRDGGHGA